MNLHPVTTQLCKQSLAAPIMKMDLPLFSTKKVRVFIKREDLSHPYLSGNKLRKLKYNLIEASTLGYQTLLTFGGAYSNHIIATAAAGHEYGFKTIGVIRGEELGKKIKNVLKENETLKQAYRLGMRFHFISREDYQKKEEDNFIKKLIQNLGKFYLIPEGGTNKLAVKGSSEILSDDPRTMDFEYIACAMGTGGTIAGLVKVAKTHQTILGFPVLKNASFLEKVIQKYTSNKNYKIITNYHFGGYAKYTPEFIDFINSIKQQTGVPLDPIYTGKMIYGLVELIKNDYFDAGSRILIIHTGGLQGIKGFNRRLKRKNQPRLS